MSVTRWQARGLSSRQSNILFSFRRARYSMASWVAVTVLPAQDVPFPLVGVSEFLGHLIPVELVFIGTPAVGDGPHVYDYGDMVFLHGFLKLARGDLFVSGGIDHFTLTGITTAF